MGPADTDITAGRWTYQRSADFSVFIDSCDVGSATHDNGCITFYSISVENDMNINFVYTANSLTPGQTYIWQFQFKQDRLPDASSNPDYYISTNNNGGGIVFQYNQPAVNMWQTVTVVFAATSDTNPLNVFATTPPDWTVNFGGFILYKPCPY